MTDRAQRFLESPLCELIFSGRYSELLKQTVDSRSGGHPPAETPFVVGALVFSGRQDEAIAALRWWTKEHGDDPTVHVAGHFFLCIGECRAGRYASTIAHVRAVVSGGRRDDVLHTFFAHQSIGLLRHFTGHTRSAVRHAAIARQAALEARFSYGRMLALDLLGHALVLDGQIHAGLAVLDQSAELAESLGLVANAGAPRTAAAAYRARFGVAGFDAPRALGALVATMKPEDAYSRRMLLSELAIHQAFAGNGAAAREHIDEASCIALPDGDRRAKVRLLIADAIVTGFSREPSRARKKLVVARSMLEPALDRGLDIELSWAEVLVRGRLRNDDPMEQRRIDALARVTHGGRARVMAATGDTLATEDPHGEDRIAALIWSLEHDPDEARRRIISQALWGWLPRLFGLEPGRRIFLLHAEGLLVVEEHGAVLPTEMPGGVLVRLLEAIAGPPMQKDELLRRVWGVRLYRADRHDSLVHTTISRLRTALGRAGSWIHTTGAGYTIADGVALVHHGGPRTDDGRVSDAPPERSTTSGAHARQTEVDARRLRALRLTEKGPLSTSELASHLEISEMTAFRLLTTLAKEGILERTGQGKRTRYRVRRP